MIKKFLRSMFVLSAICSMALYDAAHKTTAAEYTDEQGYCAMWDGQDVIVKLPNGRTHSVHQFDCLEGFEWGCNCNCDWNFHPSAPIVEITGPVLTPQAALERFTRVRKREHESAIKRAKEKFFAQMSERIKSDDLAVAQSASAPEPIHAETQAVLIPIDEEDQEPVQNSGSIIYSDATPTLTGNLAPVRQVILSSEFFPAASHESDALSEAAAHLTPAQQPFLIVFEDEGVSPTQRAVLTPPEASKQEEDPLLSAFEKQRSESLRRAEQAKETVAKQARTLEALKKLVQEKDEAEKKAQEYEELAADQARQIAEMMALLNSSPKPNPQGSGPSSVSRPVSDIAIPQIARGYEDIYGRFLGGKLIYRPKPGSDEGKIELLISDLANPLEGTFDLSGCGDTEEYLSISTGYRKGLKAENSNKLEIWLALRFVLDRELESTARYLQPIMGNWDADKVPGWHFMDMG